MDRNLSFSLSGSFGPALLALALLLSPALKEKGVAALIHVKSGATGAGDGTSWANAFPHLQDALAAAGEGAETWLAAGTYSPDRGAEQTAGDHGEPDSVFGTDDDGFHLRLGAPAIDDGNTAFVEEGETDLAGHPRTHGESVDLGAYESGSVAPVFVSEPIGYRWEVDGEELADNSKFSGTASPALTIRDAQPEDEGSYVLVASNAMGTRSSDAAELTVIGLEAPEIHTHPQDLTAFLGDAITFSVGAGGERPLAFLWFHNGRQLSGKTARELEIENVTSTDAGRYAVLVTNVHGSALSAEGILTVREFERTPPEFVVQPQATAAFMGQTVVLTAEASGAPLIEYQWFKDGEALQDDGRFSGTQSASLTVADAQPEDSGTYTLVVSNEFGETTSEPAEVAVEEVLAPRITEQPRDTGTHLGETVTLSLSAVGVEPLQYEWFRNGLPVDGATGRTLQKADVSQAEAGAYTALVTNQHGSALSRQAHLTVHPVEALPYDTWISDFGLSPEERGDTATPAGDGIPNLFKYVTGEDPVRPMGSPFENRLILSFDYASDIVDVRFILERSEDRSTWEPIPLESHPHKMEVELEDGYYRVYVWFDEPVAETAGSFFRLQAAR